MEKPQSWRRSADSLEEIARLMSSGKERDIVLQMARSRRRRAAELEAKQIPGATLHIVKGADHGLPIGWADQFNAAVLEFLIRKP